MGFVMNQYNRCVVNKVINGKQCTIVWHVDDLKISHINPSTITKMIQLLDDKYGQEIVDGKRVPVVAHRGKVHEYLGMTINFSSPGKVMFTMYDYIHEMLQEIPDKFIGRAATPATNNLFNIKKETQLLNDAKYELFHHLTAKVLFLSKRAQPDLQTAVSFLCTRVKVPNKYGWYKLRRLMMYIQATKELPL